MFSNKAKKIGKVFTVHLTPSSKHQIDGEDIVNFRGLLRKYLLKKFRLDFTRNTTPFAKNFEIDSLHILHCGQNCHFLS